MNDGYAQLAMVLGPAATRLAARSALPDAPVVPDAPPRRRVRRRQRGRSRSRLG